MKPLIIILICLLSTNIYSQIDTVFIDSTEASMINNIDTISIKKRDSIDHKNHNRRSNNLKIRSKSRTYSNSSNNSSNNSSSLNISIQTDNKSITSYILNKTNWDLIESDELSIIIDTVYIGDYKGIWIFGSYWEERGVCEIKYKELSNIYKIRVDCYITERKDKNFKWSNKEESIKFKTKIIKQLNGY